LIGRLLVSATIDCGVGLGASATAGENAGAASLWAERFSALGAMMGDADAGAAGGCGGGAELGYVPLPPNAPMLERISIAIVPSLTLDKLIRDVLSFGSIRSIGTVVRLV
jgi:hypothetical protein